MVNIVNLRLLVDKLNQVLDNRGDVFLGKDTHIVGNIKPKFCVNPITSYITQIITFLREEQLLNNATCRLFVWRLGIAQLPVDILTCLFGIVGSVFLEGIVDYRIINTIFVFCLDEDRLHIKREYLFDMFLCKLYVTLNNDFRTLHGNDLAGILIHEIFSPSLDNTGCKLLADNLFQVIASHLYFLCQLKDIEDILVRLISDGTQQSSYREFLLTVDISIHHIVYIGRELHPRTLERYDTCRIELCTVGMELGAEEHARRTMQLRHNNTLCTVDDEGTLRGHIRYHA